MITSVGHLAKHIVSGMLDILNETLVKDGKEPIAFDSDRREGIAALARLRLTASHTAPIIRGGV